MKKSIISLLAIFGLLVFTSCEDTAGPVIEGAPDAPIILQPSTGDSFVLTEDEKDNEMDFMEWSEVDFGFQAAVDYTIEIDSESSSFDNSVNLVTVNKPNYHPTVGEFNAALLRADIPAEEETEIHVRIIAELSEASKILTSSSISITVTPYVDESLAPTYPEELYMIGNSVGSWDWNDVDLPMIPVYDKPHLFWKIVWIDAGVGDPGYKFAPEQGWGNDFGYNGEEPVDGVVQFGGDNMPEPEESGYYMVVVNFETEEIAVVEPEVYLIGDTVGSWDSNIPENLFTVDNENEVLTITKNFEAGDLRMYAWYDGGWFTDWWQSEFIFFDGEIEYRGNGPDQERVAIPAGEATIELNFRDETASIN